MVMIKLYLLIGAWYALFDVFVLLEQEKKEIPNTLYELDEDMKFCVIIITMSVMILIWPWSLTNFIRKELFT